MEPEAIVFSPYALDAHGLMAPFPGPILHVRMRTAEYIGAHHRYAAPRLSCPSVPHIMYESSSPLEVPGAPIPIRKQAPGEPRNFVGAEWLGLRVCSTPG